MRDALTGTEISSVPLGEDFIARFKQPYAVTHRADIHGVYLKACQGSNLISLENSRRVDDFTDHGDGVTVRLEGGEDELFARFAGQRPEVLRLLERIETWRMWVLCDREPIKDWTQGRTTLLGDAAHPMLQYLAQGACMATE